MGRASFNIAVLFLAIFSVGAQMPSSLDYSGRIEVDGKPFSGSGYFSFAIMEASGVILWSSGEFPFVGKTNVSPTATRLAVNNGTYNVRLGALGGSTPAMDLTLLRRSRDPRLRIWFNDGIRGWNLAGEDVPLAPALASSGGANTAQPGEPTDTAAILRELRELRAKVDRQAAPAAPLREPPPQIVTVPIGHSPRIGKADAPLVLVEFTDFQCFYCHRFDETVMPDLKKKYIDTGKLQVISRSMPLAFHTNAPSAANAALCADAQKKFWEMREVLFLNSTNLSIANYLRFAEDLKLDMAAFRACVNGNVYGAQIVQDSKDGEAVNITGTPSFVLGKLSGDKVTGPVIVGARPLASFEAEINKQLAAGK
jgi:protein-disulfide isomerase